MLGRNQTKNLTKEISLKESFLSYFLLTSNTQYLTSMEKVNQFKIFTKTCVLVRLLLATS